MRTRTTDTAHVIGAAFAEPARLDAVLELREVLARTRVLSGTLLEARPWCVSGGEPMKALLAELRLLMEDAEPGLTALEKSIPSHVLHAEPDSSARQALVERVQAEVIDEWHRLYDAIGTLPFPTDPADHRAIEEFARRHLDHFLVQSPWLLRAREKPLGTPAITS